MCLILIAYQTSKKYPIILAANRDEFHARPTAAMQYWEDNPDILAGKDLEQGGTWFGVHKTGKFAGLTNYRNPSENKAHAPSRGRIIPDFLESSAPCESYFTDQAGQMAGYNGFNLLFGSLDHLFWFSNITGQTQAIPPGVHGLSNKDLNTPWPKVTKGIQQLENAVNHGFTTDDLFEVLKDTAKVDDPLLPDTGVGIEWERRLSPIFIQSPVYGTRSSTLMLIRPDGAGQIIERTYTDHGNSQVVSEQAFTISGKI